MHLIFLTHGDLLRATDDDGNIVAEYGPTFTRHPTFINLYPRCTDAQRSEILERVTWAVPRHNWSPEDTHEHLKREGVKVHVLAHETVEDAVEAALDRVATPVRFELGRTHIGGDLSCRFRVHQPHRFEFWKAHGGDDPAANWCLNLTPDYHPHRQGVMEYGLINGDTDCLITSSAVRYVRAPRAAQAELPDTRFRSATWAHVKHPFLAAGRTLDVRLNPNEVRTAEGVESFVRFLRAALRLEGYIAVSGGFRPPLRSPHNHLIKLGRGRAWGQCRGSEASAVWEYRTLKAEGKLQGAIIPQWLEREGWLGVYEGAEERHGLY